MSVAPPAQPQLYSTETGEPINADPSQYAALVQSGKGAFLKGVSVPVVDHYGNAFSISGSDFARFSSEGGQYEPLDSQAARVAKAKYGNEPIRAGAEALARGATLGGSDWAMRGMGVPAEDLAGRKSENPLISGSLEIAGAVAPILASGGAGAAADGGLSGAARFAPTSLLARAGTAAADATADLVGSSGAKSLAGKIVQRAAPAAAAGAIEGAGYGAGNVLSESALGDTNDIAEKTLAQMGGGALIGGLGGALIGSIFPHVKEPAAKPVIQGAQPLVSELDKTVNTVEDATRLAVNSPELSDSERKAFTSDMTQEAKHAPDVKEAGEVFGVHVFPEQVTNSSAKKSASAILDNSMSPTAIARNNMKADAIEKVVSGTEQVFGKGAEVTEAQAGQQLQKQITEKFEAMAEPHQALYKILDENLPHIPISDPAKAAIIANIKKLDGYNITGSLLRSASDYVVDNLPNMKTARDIQNLAQSLSEKVNPAIAGERRVAAILKEKLDNLVENSAIRAGNGLIEQTGDQSLKGSIQQVLDAIPASKKAYASFREKLNAFAKEMGRKRIGGLADFQDFIEGLKPYQVLDKMFDKRDAGFIKFLKSEFPEEAQTLLSFKRSQMLEKAQQAESLKPIFKGVRDLSPEVRGQMFSQQELRKIELAEKYLETVSYSRSPVFGNPSRTSYTHAAGKAFESPQNAVLGWGRDLAIKKFIEAGSSGVDGAAAKTFSKLEGMAQKSTAAVSSIGKSFLSNAHAIVPAAASKLLKSEDGDREEKKKKFDKAAQLIVNAASNQEGLVDKNSSAVAPISGHAPLIASTMAQKASVGPLFLSSKLPQNPFAGDVFSSHKKWYPSDADLNKFHKYVDAVDDPISTMKLIKENRFTPEHAEAMQAVYPGMFRELQAHVMEGLPKLKEELPYQKKLQLGVIMGAPLDQTMTPGFVAQMQMQHMNAQAQEEQKKANEMGSKKLSFADNAKSGTERVLTRT